MTQRGTSLTDLLCDLYRYFNQLANQLDALVRSEAAETARARGEPDDYVRLLADPSELFRRLTEADQNIARDDGRQRIDLVEAKDRVVRQLRKAGKPAGESRAWRHAVHWLGDRLPGVRRSRVEPCLQRYCEFKLIDRVPPQEQVDQLGLATAAWPGGAIKGRAILMHAARGGQSNTLVPDERDKLWSQEGDEANESAYRELVAGIVDLDEQGKGDELVSEICERYPDEAKDAGLLPFPKRSLVHIAEGRAGDGPGQTDAPHSACNGGVLTGVYGDWRDHIANCVHEDARDERKLRRYQVMIRNWAEGIMRNARPATIPLRDYLKQQHPTWTEHEIDEHVRMHDFVDNTGAERRGESSEVLLHDPISITTHSATPPDKKFATLAAIHDASGHCHFPIDPWAGKHWQRADECSPEELFEFHVAMKYEILKSLVPDLTELERTGIERFLDDVAKVMSPTVSSVTLDHSAAAGAPTILIDARNQSIRNSYRIDASDRRTEHNEVTVFTVTGMGTEDAEASKSGGTPPKGKGGRGRQQMYDKKKDAQYAAAWNTGEHASKAACASALGITESELKKALERHRKRSE